MSARRELAVWEPYNQWFLVGFRADVIQCEVTDQLLFSENIHCTTELNRFAADDHGALMSYLEESVRYLWLGGGGGGGVKLTK